MMFFKNGCFHVFFIDFGNEEYYAVNKIVVYEDVQ